MLFEAVRYLLGVDRANGRVEDLLLDGHVCNEVVGELGQHTGVTAFELGEQCLSLAMMFLEECGGFHARHAKANAGPVGSVFGGACVSSGVRRVRRLFRAYFAAPTEASRHAASRERASPRLFGEPHVERVVHRRTHDPRTWRRNMATPETARGSY